MKKFTFFFQVALLFGVMTTASAKDITIYVQADQQPNIHFWNVSTETSEWPGVKLTETTTVKNLQDEEITFYYKTFTGLADDAAISFLFNYDGDADKTADINSVTDDHYYIFKGNHEYEDITSQFKEVIPATIEKVQLPGSYCSWTGDNAPMTDNGDKTYSYTLDLSESTDEVVYFKLLVADGTNSHWLGWNDLFISAPDGWLQDDGGNDHNIQLNLAAIGIKVFTVTAEWAGGENASVGWSLQVTSTATGINTLCDSQSVTNGYYNLSGQRVAQPLKGLYIQNGKKFIK
jgi:hypothetical protein